MAYYGWLQIGHMVNEVGNSFEDSCFQAVADRYGLLSEVPAQPPA